MTVEKKKKPLTRKWWFWVIIVVLVIGTIGSIGGDDNDKDTEPSSTPEVTPDAIPETAPVITLSPDEVKSQAKINDGVMIAAVYFGDNYHTALNESLGGLETGSSNLLDIYDLCEDIKDHIPDFDNRLDEIDDDTIEDYRDIVSGYLWNYYSIADDIIDYIDNNKMASLSNAQEGIQLIPTYLNMIDEAREAYLTQAGFTVEEVAEILSQ